MNALTVALAPQIDLATLDEDAIDPCRDYAIIRSVIALISEDYRDQPQADAIAFRLGLDPVRLTRLFQRWAGLTPKAFLQAVTLDHARRLLDDSATLLDATYELGLSGPGRLHDLFVTHEAISPGAYKSKGDGMVMRTGFHPSPFGIAVVVATDYGLAGLAFADEGEEKAALDDLMRRWPNAAFQPDQAATEPYARHTFDPSVWSPSQPLKVVLIGTDFEVRVWRSLLDIPMGKATTYSSIAAALGKPSASRAVGAAVGKNPISFVVPCHRVLGKSGALTGYHWGLTRKRAMLGWEAGHSSAR